MAGRLVQKSLVVGQAVDYVVIDWSLERRKRVETFDGSALKKGANSAVHHMPLPQEDVMKGMEVGHQS